MPRDRIARFIATPEEGDFGELALAAFRYQHQRVPAYRALCAARGVEPEALTDWRLIPAVPTLAFKTLELATDEPREVFRSSGTSGTPSVHRHPYPELYRLAIDASFPSFCLAGLDRPPVLALVPTRAQAPESSLAFMIDHVREHWGGSESITAFGSRGVDVPAARSWVAARQRQGAPCLVASTSFALAQLLEAFERRRLRFRLPPGSVVFDTGGFKGHRRELHRDQLLASCEHALGVPPSRFVREYGMTELSSQCYTTTLTGGPEEVFVTPPWMRARVLSPESLEEQRAGAPGLLTFLDLANLGSAVHVLTEDIGVAEGDGFRLLGRADDAELRGCSLTVEELEAAGPVADRLPGLAPAAD